MRLKGDTGPMLIRNDATTVAYPSIKIKHILFYASIFVAVPILTYFVGGFLDYVFRFPSFPPFPINLVLGSAVFCSGLAIGIKATRTLFKKGQGLPWGEFNGQSRSKTLVTHGIYAYTRNPMVLGYSLLPCGMGIMFRSISMTTLVPALTVVASVWVAKTREEPRLYERFGATYSDYKRNTPFLIPRLIPLIVDLARSILATRKEADVGKLVRVRNVQVIFYSISLLSLVVLAALALVAQPGNVQVRKEAVGTAFGAICVMGIIAGISPSRCNRLFMHFETKVSSHFETGNKSQDKHEISYKGHHPDCGRFSSHIIHIGSGTYCAGCTGLVVGATIALIGIVFYVLQQSLPMQLVPATFWSGLAGVTLGLLQYVLFTKRASIHFLLNVVFVFGAFLLLIGVTGMNSSLSVGIYLLLVILFLIDVRSTLSRLEHEKKCITCSVEHCSTK